MQKKVDSVRFTNGNPTLYYTYDAQGNRLSKRTNPDFANQLYQLPRLNRPTAASTDASVGILAIADYTPFIWNPYTRLEGGNPALIATPHGYTLYSTMTRNNSYKGYKEVDNTPIPNLFFEQHRVYNYSNGNLIYDAYESFYKN